MNRVKVFGEKMSPGRSSWLRFFYEECKCFRNKKGKMQRIWVCCTKNIGGHKHGKIHNVWNFNVKKEK